MEADTMKVLFFFSLFFTFYFYSSSQRNDSPVIGILVQLPRFGTADRRFFIAASYVKFLEAAGAKVVPIRLRRSLGEYKEIFNSINGLLLPGGSTNMYRHSYLRTVKILYNLALEANKKGDYFPVWGTCLGFQALFYMVSHETTLTRTNSKGVAMPLNITEEGRSSRMLSGFPDELIQELASQPLALHSHWWSLTLRRFYGDHKLKTFYRAISTNSDEKREYVSTLEGYHYPFYGTQWHPEKLAFEWNQSVIPHNSSGIRIMFYFAEFFVNEARKNFHSFKSKAEERKALIWNYCAAYSGQRGVYVQKFYT